MTSPDKPDQSVQRQRSGRLRTATAVADPSITVIETGKTFGLLVAATFDGKGAQVRLGDVLWVRRTLRAGVIGRLSRRYYLHSQHFDEVIVHQDDQGSHVAEDAASHRYFPYPSSQAYQTTFISADQHRSIAAAVGANDVHRLIAEAGPLLASQNVRFVRHSLRAPSPYAAPAGHRPAGNILLPA